MVDFQSVLSDRLSGQIDSLLGALHFYEGRSADEITEAVSSFQEWATVDEGSDDDSYLPHILETYIESGVHWATNPESFKNDFPLKSETPWEIQEFHLVASLYLTKAAFHHFCSESQESRFLVSILYADAVEAWQQWQATRGPGRCRNPDARFVKFDSALRRLESHEAIKNEFSSRAKRGAQKKLERDSDGKQAAKLEAFNRWVAWQNGSVAHKSGAAFARHIVETLPIENTKTVERWMQAWRKDMKTGPR